jgi:hypothetical protein
MRSSVPVLLAVLALSGCGRDSTPRTEPAPVPSETMHPAATEEELRAAGATVLSVENCLDGQGSDETVRYGDRDDAIRVARIGSQRYRVELLRLVGRDGIDPTDRLAFEQRVDPLLTGEDGFRLATPLDEKTRDAMRRGGCARD